MGAGAGAGLIHPTTGACGMYSNTGAGAAQQEIGKVDGAAHVFGHRSQLGLFALDTEALHDIAQLHYGAVALQATQGSQERKRVGTP